MLAGNSVGLYEAIPEGIPVVPLRPWMMMLPSVPGEPWMMIPATVLPSPGGESMRMLARSLLLSVRFSRVA